MSLLSSDVFPQFLPWWSFEISSSIQFSRNANTKTRTEKIAGETTQGGTDDHKQTPESRKLKLK